MLRRALLLLALALLLAPAAAAALPLADGVYQLLNHPDGNAGPPSYGLRLDGLTTGDGSDTHTFSFDPADGASISMTIAGKSISIEGTVFGGQVSSGAYVGGGSFWDVSFSYTNATIIGMTHEANTGTGSITEQGGESYDLIAFDGNDPNTPEDDGKGFAFRLATNHRGVDGFSGFGWMNHSGAPGGLDEHLYASDWLFTVATPEASGLALLAPGLLGLAIMGRRRRR